MFEDVIDNISSTKISESSVHGFGLFATRKILKSELLATLDGQVIPWRLHEKNQLTEEWNAVAEDRVLVRPYRTKYYFINHSRVPNLVVKRTEDCFVHILPLRDIEAGEELLLDYRNEPLAESYLKGHGATYL